MLICGKVSFRYFREILISVILEIPNPKYIDVIFIPCNRFWAALNGLKIRNEIFLQPHIIWINTTQKLGACDVVLSCLSWHYSHLTFMELVAETGFEPVSLPYEGNKETTPILRNIGGRGWI